MNSPVTGLRVASAIFGLMGLVHLIRLFVCVSMQVGGCYVGRRWSVVAAIFLGALCIWMWRLASKAAQPKTETPPAGPAA
jgi:type VI protein secretion system component VasK